LKKTNAEDNMKGKPLTKKVKIKKECIN